MQVHHACMLAYQALKGSSLSQMLQECHPTSEYAVLLTRNTIILQCIALATSRWRTTGASTRRWHMSALLTVCPRTQTTTHPLCLLPRPTAQPAQPMVRLTRLLTGPSEMGAPCPLSFAHPPALSERGCMCQRKNNVS